MQKKPRRESPRIQYGGLGISLGLVLCGLIGIPITALLQRKRTHAWPSHLARLAAWLTCLAWGAGFVVCMTALQDAQKIVFGPTKGLILVLNIWAAAAVLTIAMVIFTVLAWRRSWWHRTGRVWFTLILLGAIGCALWLNHWNLLGWRY
jgi:hypothetical protein